MKKMFSLAIVAMVASFSFALAPMNQADADNASIFTPVRPSALRLPAVPLVANDPYFALWSHYDHLYDGHTGYFRGQPKPMIGVLRVDGQCYRFMGMNFTTVAPMATEEKWAARYLMNEAPAEGWQQPAFDDSSWRSGRGAFGGGDGAYGNIGTQWSGLDTDVYVRRTFNIADYDAEGEYYVTYKHDDVCELYFNGELIAKHGNEWNTDGLTIAIPAELVHEGENIFAAHCHNTAGGAYLDFGLFQNTMNTAVQNSVTVLATNTYYNFSCGPVCLDVVFTSPQLIDDLETQSFPGTFLSYQVTSTDGREHDVQFYFEASAQIAVSNSGQATTTSRVKTGSYVYAKAGNSSQGDIHATGDGMIDWGHFYLYSDLTATRDITVNDHSLAIATFQAEGKPVATKSSVSQAGGTYPAIAYIDQMGAIGAEPSSGRILLAYDDNYSINYMGSKRKAYWTTLNSRTSFLNKTRSFLQDYDNLMLRCRALDERIYDDALASGGWKYAEILSGVYRQTMTAHKLVTDTEGNLLWMSRENDSGGFINTVDITYPSAPLFLVYNPELCRAMMTPQFDYAATGKWTKGYAAHDLGAYPNATGQTYGGDMPLEESADMIILSAALLDITADRDYAEKYWPLLTTWADYLEKNGRTPTNQLCTDDFMGPSEKNANLSLKSTLGVFAYAHMAQVLGKADVASTYERKAKAMSQFWRTYAMTNTTPKHSRLAMSGSNNDWSEKYNMVWDVMWNWNHFEAERLADMEFYQTKMLRYGLPLDSRANINKNDWHFWIAAIAKDDAEFQTYVDPMYAYANETPTRVPLSDLHNAVTGQRHGFMARPVVAGYWMKVLMDKFRSGELSAIQAAPLSPAPTAPTPLYDLQGRRVQTPAPGIYIQNGRKQIKK